ncbi:MAG: c-type cytochrome [Thiotrichales bacterium]
MPEHDVAIQFGVTGTRSRTSRWLAALIAACAWPLAQADLPAPRQQELRNFFVQDCGSCHGLTMRGGLGGPLLPENLKDKPDDYLYAVIMEGIPGQPMPPWKALLNDADVAFLIRLMRQGPDQ